MVALQTYAYRGPEQIIEIIDLKAGFADHIVLKNLNLTVVRGEILAIVGGSGAGKSVLLDAMIGLKPLMSGAIKIFGEYLTHISERKRIEIDHRWGVMFQGGALFSNLNVKSNIAAPMIEHGGFDESEIEALADLKLALVGLDPEIGLLRPAELSGGMRKRVALARSLSLDPELLFLDEPTAGLDPVSAGEFDDLILNLSRSLGITVVLITHDLDTLYAITDRVAVLADQKIAACAPVRSLERSDHPWIHQYFHGQRGRAAAAAANPEHG